MPRTLDMFAAEADGLRELEAAGGHPRAASHRQRHARQPGVPGAGMAATWTGAAAAADLGRRLAQLHRTTPARLRLAARQHHRQHPAAQSRRCRIGSSSIARAAPRAPSSTWPRGNGAPARLHRPAANACWSCLAFFPGYRPIPSLLHGDLWGGNSRLRRGEPVLFDPAVYYGDREADLAMTELFGGFPAEFYAAYREAWPLDPGLRHPQGTSTTSTTCSTTSTCSAAATPGRPSHDRTRCWRNPGFDGDSSN